MCGRCPALLHLVPQFSHSMHEQVVYESISHRHRRGLHRKAASVLEKRLERVTGVLERRPFLKELTRHLLNAAQLSSGGTGIDSSGSINYHQMEESEVARLADAMGKAAENSTTLGDYEETVEYLVRPRLERYRCTACRTASAAPAAWEARHTSMRLPTCLWDWAHGLSTDVTARLWPPGYTGPAAGHPGGAEHADGALGAQDP